MLDNILDRLEFVKQQGDKYQAKCPAHNGVSNTSLALKEVEDKVLIHCFGGCEPAEVLTSLGLDIAEMFARPQDANIISKRKWQKYLEKIKHERNIITMCNNTLDNGGTLTLNDYFRWHDAAMRVIKHERKHGK